MNVESFVDENKVALETPAQGEPSWKLVSVRCGQDDTEIGTHGLTIPRELPSDPASEETQTWSHGRRLRQPAPGGAIHAGIRVARLGCTSGRMG